MSTSVSELGALDLLKETLTTTAQLADKQLELLRAELTETIAAERRRLIFVSIGIASSIAGIAVLLVAAALGIGLAIGHAALLTLVIGVVVLITGAALLTIGIRGLTDAPLPSSRHIVDEEIKWAKDKLGETTLSTSPETSNDSAVVGKH